MTLFQTGNDLSEDYKKVCVRTLKTDTFDVYVLLANPQVKVKHSARREKPEHLGNGLYIAGEAYDSFDVWIMEDANNEACKAENVKSFEDALTVAMFL